MNEGTKKSETPTAADAVAGMLMRYGSFDQATDLATGYAPPLQIAGAMSELVPPSAERDICIAALEALARGDLHVPGAASAHAATIDGAIERLGGRCGDGLWPLAERVARERDALIEEIDRLRARDTAWQRVTQHSDSDAFPMAVCGGAPTTTAPPRAQWISRGPRCAPLVDAVPSREPNDAGGGP